MNLFKRHAVRGIAPDSLAGRLSHKVIKQQRKAADYLFRKTQYWNRSTKITALVVFCLLFGGCCVLLLCKSIIHF